MNGQWFSASEFYKQQFGTKTYKIALNIGCTCPTRDGTKGSGGCIFCSAAGSGDFTAPSLLSIEEQAAYARQLIDKKLRGRTHQTNAAYIAYFQNFTNTYGENALLESYYRQAASLPGVRGIAIATRPDCISDDILNRIAALCDTTFVSIELGLQTAHDTTAQCIHRGYATAEYDNAVARIKKADSRIHIVTHVIFGLPGETKQDMLATVRRAVTSGTDGIKFTVLYVVNGTVLAEMYQRGEYTCMTMSEYFDVLSSAVTLLPPHIIIHRMTGDGPKNILAAPQWTADKKRVLSALHAYFKRHNIHQGSAV